ncbi:MAG TPA: IPT/TIG domain-containing protein, partial [Planctomycetota bacterium]|nr:IPT/TIG domain-containing protein [Planctomycetota bacterium]
AGPAAGGTAVTLVGVGFLPGAAVSFGGVAATGVVVAPTTISCTAPAHAASAVVVSVVNPDGQTATAPGVFTYVPNLVLSAASPTSGPPGTVVTLTGSGFEPSMSLSVGGVPTAAITVTATTATFAVPAPVACDGVVAVTTSFGQAAFLPFNASPTITGSIFATGAAAGGLPLLLSGTNFQPGLTVTIGGAAATIVNQTPTSLFVTTPPGAPGPAAVVVTAPSTCSATTTYTYL